jgi:opacity protein-like surface antigen
MSQTADLTHLMNTGFLVGVKAGYMPKALRKIFSAELEFNYQKTTVNRITSPGFVAGVDTIPAFSSKAENSLAKMNSLWLNLLVRYPKGSVHPFIGFSPGLTYATIAFHEQNIVGNFGFEETGSDTDFAWQVQFGCDFDISTLFSVGGGYKYMAVTPKMPWANGTYSDYEYHSSTIFANIAFHF